MLTRRQKQIIDYIDNYRGKKGISPTLEEIAKHLHLSSIATVHQHLTAIEKKGYLKKEHGHARAIETTTPNKSRFTKVLLLGTVSAGNPIEAIRNPESLEVPKDMLSNSGKFYALKVQGDSMIEDGIFNDDIVVVRHQSVVNNGENAVAYLPDKDTVTLKRIYQEKNRVKLVPANKKMRPFYEKSVEIQGKIVGILRKYG